MSDTTSVVLVGVGGQGILLASEILAQTAMLAGYDVKTNEVHGMAQRGGSVMAQVRYGQKVYSPLIEEGTAVALASLEQIEGLRAAHYLREDGLAVVSSQQVIPVTVSSGGAEYPLDAVERVQSVFKNVKLVDAVAIAAEAGNSKAANVAVIGALSTGLEFSEDLWIQAIKKSVKPAFIDLNIEVFKKSRNM